MIREFLIYHQLAVNDHFIGHWIDVLIGNILLTNNNHIKLNNPTFLQANIFSHNEHHQIIEVWLYII